MTNLERSAHSFVGEAATIRWAIAKFCKYFFEAEFTILTDCAGLQQFFEKESLASHIVNRWRAELLQYHFTIEHHPARMMYECDLLSKYNTSTAA